jgi:mersacidin/lichenicidin family type 2 lantibiotic
LLLKETQNHKTKGEYVMTTNEIVRSWKDENFRLSLSNTDQAFLPDNPAGLIELSDDDLRHTDGGTDTRLIALTPKVTLLFCLPPSTLNKGCKLDS